MLGERAPLPRYFPSIRIPLILMAAAIRNRIEISSLPFDNSSREDRIDLFDYQLLDLRFVNDDDRLPREMAGPFDHSPA